MTDLTTPHRAFLSSARQRPDQVFLLAPACAGLPWAPNGFSITYAEAAEQVEALAARYAAAGYGRGSRIALLLENRPGFVLHWLAINSIGASIAPLNGDMRPEELQHQLVTSGVETIITVAQFLPLLERVPHEGIRIATITRPIPPARTPRTPDGGHGDDEAALLFTSGSSGKPKACILSNFYFMNVAQWYVSMPGVAAMTPGQEVSLTPLPFFHMNALGCTAVGMMLIGGTIVPLDRFHPGSWWQTIADSGATIVHSLGVIPAILLKRPEGPFDRAHRARFTFGPGVDVDHKRQFEDRFNLPIVEGWAMTETGGGAVTDTAGVEGVSQARCVGAMREGTEWRLVDDAGQPVPVGVAGELQVRAAGPDPRRGFFSGYLGDAAATDQAWEGGWFHTGDMLSADENGLLYFVDRKKSIIRRSGENISALEVEAVMDSDPGVAAVAVTPVPDPLREEEVFAFVVPRPGQEDAEALMRRLAERMSYHKLPGFLVFCEALPVSSTQKLQRGQIKVDAEAAVRAENALDLRALKAQLRREFTV
ncbi:MAG: ATP-dependent acyl-CoA ligase [Rhodobacteraceae bacterium]|nr:ATP-dependent acyl-CoA ligase [Paracoccaceae bacterium]MAY48097.1 ATP-dependent acyl-CoA ligase [Paracoccaceae bacterium]